MVGLLVVLALPGGMAENSPSPAVPAPGTLWAYGAVETVSLQGTSHGWQYSGSAVYGFSVILNQTNTTTTSIELAVNRTMGVLFQVHYCYPDCSSPTYFGNESYHVYETVDATANLSTTGTVYENDTPVAALSLLNSGANLRANVTETGSWYLRIGGVLGTRSHYLSANVVASSTVYLSPGLGLFPTTLNSAQSWNSSSQFSSRATADYAYYEAASGPRGAIHFGPFNGNFSVPANGTVGLNGSYSPTRTVNLGGVTFPEVALRVVGPFSVREGFILLPSAADLFGGGNPPWSAQQNGSASAAMSYLDARATEGDHLGIGASQWVYDSTMANPSGSATALSGNSQLAAASTGISDSAPSTDGPRGPGALGDGPVPTGLPPHRLELPVGGLLGDRRIPRTRGSRGGRGRGHRRRGGGRPHRRTPPHATPRLPQRRPLPPGERATGLSGTFRPEPTSPRGRPAPKPLVSPRGRSGRGWGEGPTSRGAAGAPGSLRSGTGGSPRSRRIP